MSPEQSDAEVICGFMEPRPDHIAGPDGDPEEWPGHWWSWYRDRNGHTPRTLDLDALRDVEQVLMDIGYEPRINGAYRHVSGMAWHLTAVQKAVALANVIRGIK